MCRSVVVGAKGVLLLRWPTQISENMKGDSYRGMEIGVDSARVLSRKSFFIKWCDGLPRNSSRFSYFRMAEIVNPLVSKTIFSPPRENEVFAYSEIPSFFLLLLSSCM